MIGMTNEGMPQGKQTERGGSATLTVTSQGSSRALTLSAKPGLNLGPRVLRDEDISAGEV